MDALDQLILSTRRELSEAESRVERKRLELSALEKAASLRPATTSPVEQPHLALQSAPVKSISLGDAARKPGRQPGAITQPWRMVLSKLNGQSAVPYSVIHETYQKVANADITPSAVRDRVRQLVKMGWMDGEAAHGFTVTQAAADRFGFRKNEGPTFAGPSSSAGPVGREGGYPPSTPEGSTPSGSTPLFQSTRGEIDLA